MTRKDKKTLQLIGLLIGMLLFTGCAREPQAPSYTEIEASLADSKWDGKAIPKDEVCNRFNSRPGNSPAIQVENISADTVKIVLSFNDHSAGPAFNNGGHGVLSYELGQKKGSSSIMIPSIPGQVSDLPNNFTVVRNFTSKAWDSGSGYLPPCSGGRNNLYSVDIRAYNENNELTGEAKVRLGRY